jgi:hypothetical protein
MIKASLDAFVARVMATKVMEEADVHLLERSILADGVSSRREAELLLRLDRNLEAVDASWCDYLVVAMVDFVVWGARPTGYVDEGTAEWLTACLKRGGRTGGRIAREIVREAHQVDPVLAEFAERGPKRLVWRFGADAPERIAA